MEEFPPPDVYLIGIFSSSLEFGKSERG